MAKQELRDKINYISISSDGILRQSVPAGTAGAKERTYDTKKKNDDGTPVMATKIEKHFESITGKINNIAFVETEFGTLLQLTLVDDFIEDSEPDTLSINTSTEYAKDIMKKLPNVDLTKQVTFKPFCFTPEGKTEDNKVKGVTLTQEGTKVEKYFVYNPETKTTSNGFPNPDAKIQEIKSDMKRKEEWKRYFKDCEIFLVDYTTEHFVSKFDKKMVEETLDESPEDAILKDF